MVQVLESPSMPAERKQVFEAAALTDVGRVRSSNEDAFGFCAEAGVFIVCDGMGGAAAGEVASRTAVDAIVERLCAVEASAVSNQWLETAIHTANRLVHTRAEGEVSLHGMGTTLVVLVLREGKAWIAHVGDSRCYRLRRGELTRCTQDHSLVDEQVRLGQLTQEEAERSPLRNIITRAVGTEVAVTPELNRLDTESGDLFLLCTDGLSRELSQESIGAILCAQPDLKSCCEALIEAANAAGGRDNVTCLLVRVP